MKLYLIIFLLFSNTVFSQVNLTQGLIAHYPFSGNANDVSGNNINGTLNNTTITTDRNGNANSAYYFNGINSYIQLPFSNLYNFAAQDSFSISVWVLPEQGNTWPAEALVVKAPAHPDFTLSLWNYGVYLFNNKAMSGYAYNHILNSSTILTPNPCWYNIISTYKNGVWKLYINGKLESSDMSQTKFILKDGSSKITFGKKGDSFGDWYRGKMDDVRIYNRVLNDAEAAAIAGTCQYPCNNWLSLPSYQSYVNVGDLDVPGNTITVEALFSRTAPYSNGYNWAGDLVSKHVDPVDVNYLLRPNNAEITTTNGYFTTPPICEIELNKVYHAAMVYDGSSLKFYRNGYLMSSVAATGNMFQNNHQTRIGLYDALIHNTNLIGYINEVRIWNVARTQVQIKSFMNTSLPNPSTQTNLLAYYTFDNLFNKQGNTSWNGTLGGTASINATNPSCTFTADTCAVLPCAQKKDFSFTQNSCVPYQLTFATTSTNYDSIWWNFGDGNSVSGSSTVSHTYTAPGNYQVLMIQKYQSCIDTVRKTYSISIQNDTQTILTADTTICFGATKQLRSAPALTYCWSPSTYLDNPSVQNPVSSAPVNITYYLTSEKKGNNLIVNGNFSNGNTGFTSAYNYAAANITEGQYFVGASPQGWNSSLSNCGDHTTGNGNMMLVNGSPAPDIKIWTQTVTVLPNTNYSFSTWIQALWPPNPAQLQFSINNNAIGTLITASLPTCTWTQFYTTWNSGNATSATISIINKNTQVTGNDFALDDISFAPIIISRDSVKITVDTPVINTSSDSAICTGSSIQINTSGALNYQWTPISGLSNTSISNPLASPSATTKYIVTGTNSFGCIAKDSITVTVNPKPTITLSNDTLVCAGSNIQLVAGGGTSYGWSPVNTLSNPSIANPFATATSNTVYKVTVTNADNCSSTDSVRVDVRQPNTFSISPSTSICIGDSVQLVAAGGDIYNWSPTSSLSNTNLANPFAYPLNTTDYDVTISDTLCNISETLTSTVVVNPLPVLTTSKSNDVDCSNASSQLNVTGADQHVWMPSGTLNNALIRNPIASPLTTTQYIVTGKDINGCSNTDSITVLVTADNSGNYLMPNAFTPNNDGINDCFGIKNWGPVTEFEFSIYNRWGERVFYTKDPDNCWNGNYKATAQITGVYSYMINAKNACGVIKKSGIVTLIR
ncbi:LamG-like jellyroll fold domain-containing protein [Lacibacter sediminis]|uniref:Gliding motility-associated C-terminal domain-containing protein n=1 Tax=Lacibacter sediminis TaxID=2760713 RepID=A0A7G5XLB4_9BACT|nr:LamG-like jellyroll fold domain-containing protein [Lacibacter sediminis]QNA46267.1 gliding motility-associated C-terminal domain-containing protein [Lacibacter sediminis]